jgi:hypothetical protein
LPDYDMSVLPPAPVAQVEVRVQERLSPVVVPMLLDSGSDVTIVPLSAAEEAGATLRPYDSPLQTYSGELVYRDRARLSIKLLRYTFHGDYLVDDIPVGILGRNVLNALVLRLDGPSLTWSAGTS